ncbi:MAG: helix-turn-helix domain-containing protein [Flavobacteriales bacterium]|jgi:transcriptional regulator with XRE-family HTH domain
MNSHNFTAKDIHLRIRSIRTELGYSQEFVASQIGISQNAYSRIELGLAKLSIERMLKIADVLKINPLVLLTV